MLTISPLTRRLLLVGPFVPGVITLLYQLAGNPQGVSIWASVTLGQITLVILLGEPWTRTAIARLGALRAHYPLDQDSVDVRMLVAFLGLTLQIVLPVVAVVCLTLGITSAGAIMLLWALGTHLSVRLALRSMERTSTRAPWHA